jgi:hypothetical protein
VASPPAAGSIPAARASAPGFPGLSAEGVALSGKTAARVANSARNPRRPGSCVQHRPVALAHYIINRLTPETGHRCSAQVIYPPDSCL